MEKGEIPNLSKIVQITPIPKITAPKSLRVCKPIYTIPALSKVFEKLLFSRFLCCEYLYTESAAIWLPHQPFY